MTILKRGKIYQLRRRVPRRYAAIEPRSTVWINLHTDSQQIAESKAKRAWLGKAWMRKPGSRLHRS
ncbi:MAG: DUF6538 domain-containing protein [Geminicoccaceae bacterium]